MKAITRLIPCTHITTTTTIITKLSGGWCGGVVHFTKPARTITTTSTSQEKRGTTKRNIHTSTAKHMTDSEQVGNKPGVTQHAQREAAKDTIFGKIVRGEIPCKKIHEDALSLAFHDIEPKAPVHFLVIPKDPIAGLSDVHESDVPVLGHLVYVATKCAAQLGLPTNGYRLVINDGVHGQQSVRWMHIHILGGRQLNWPPG